MSYWIPEFRPVDGVVDAHGIGWLVEGEAGFHFPSDILTGVGGDGAADLPGADHAVQCRPVVDLAVDGGRLYAIDPNALDAKIGAELGVLAELGDVFSLVVGVYELFAPEVGGDTGESQALFGELGAQFLALRFRGHGARPGVVGTVGIAWVRVRRKGAEFNPVESQGLQLVDDSVEIDRI